MALIAQAGSACSGGCLFLCWTYATCLATSEYFHFYVVVIPTTMPGTFFWKNAGFEEHAREVGLADMPQVGLAYEGHHTFRLDELIEAIRTTTMKQKYAQLRSIFAG